MNKIRVLVWTDFLIPTGFGNVAEEIISRLNETGKYEFTVVAINYHGAPYNRPKSQYYRFKDIPVYAVTQGDLLNIKRFERLLFQHDYDVLFVQLDLFNLLGFKDKILAAKQKKGFRYVYYFPVDSDLALEWITGSVAIADYPVAYTNYGLQKIREHRHPVAQQVPVEAIGLGVDDKVYYPLGWREKLKKELFGIEDDAFLMMNVAMNQRRKDTPRTILMWLKVKERIPDARLYLHIYAPEDEGNGYNLPRFIRMYVPPRWRKDIAFPSDRVPKEQMSKLYGAADVIVSTSMGEGWGLPITEAMACKVPVVVPRHTSFVEIVGPNEERGRLAETDGLFVMQHDLERIRPTASIESMVEKVLEVRGQPRETQEKVDAAYQWVLDNCNWDRLAERWDEIFTEARESGNEVE